jgi:hypothetical protein
MLEELLELLKTDLEITDDREDSNLKQEILAAEDYVYSIYQVGVFKRSGNSLLTGNLSNYSGGFDEGSTESLSNVPPMLVKAVLIIARKIHKSVDKNTDLYTQMSTDIKQSIKPEHELPAYVLNYLESKKAYHL